MEALAKISRDEEGLITDVYHSTDADYLSAEEIKALTPQIVIDRLHALKPFIARHAAETEARGRPSDEVWRAILKTGFMYLSVPKLFGGLQASMMDIMDACLPISQADGSVGWLASFVIMTPRPAAGYPIEVQEELFGSGRPPVFTNVILPMGSARKVAGGYIVNGRWAWGTTIQFADYCSMICRVENPAPGEAEVRTFLTPAKNIKIIDTWAVTGMVATGTHHVTAENVFVPERYAAESNNGDLRWNQQVRKYFSDYDLFLGPPGAALALNVTVPVLGAAQGGVEAWRQHLLQYQKRSGGMLEKEKMSSQLRLAHASSLVMAAEQLMRHAIRVIFTMTKSYDNQGDDKFFECRAWLAESMEMCRNAMQVVVQSAGTSIYYKESPIGRAYRDVMTGSSHVVCDYDVCLQALGQNMLGIEPPKPQGYADRHKVRDEIKATTAAYDYTKGNT